MSSLFIPVILGTAREGRRSEHVARFVFNIVEKRISVETAFIDVREYPLMATDDSGESTIAKKLSNITQRADAFIIVSPEYNHGYPGELKMMLDMSDGEYKRKPIAICGVSAGTMGGARMIEQLRSVLIDLEAVPILEAVYFSKIAELFDEKSVMQDDSYYKRISKMLDELMWYANALKAARGKDEA